MILSKTPPGMTVQPTASNAFMWTETSWKYFGKQLHVSTLLRGLILNQINQHTN